MLNSRYDGAAEWSRNSTFQLCRHFRQDHLAATSQILPCSNSLLSGHRQHIFQRNYLRFRRALSAKLALPFGVSSTSCCLSSLASLICFAQSYFCIQLPFQFFVPPVLESVVLNLMRIFCCLTLSGCHSLWVGKALVTQMFCRQFIRLCLIACCLL